MTSRGYTFVLTEEDMFTRSNYERALDRLINDARLFQHVGILLTDPTYEVPYPRFDDEYALADRGYVAPIEGIAGLNRKYPQTAAGAQQFRHDLTEMEKTVESGTRALAHTLVNRISKEILLELKAHPNWANYVETRNIVQMWALLREACRPIGAGQLNMLFIELFNLKIDGFTLASYYNRHVELREAIIRQAPAAEQAAWRASNILTRIQDILFVFGFGNNPEFAHDLQRLAYDQAEFPAAADLAGELTRLQRNRAHIGVKVMTSPPVANAARPRDTKPSGKKFNKKKELSGYDNRNRFDDDGGYGHDGGYDRDRQRSSRDDDYSKGYKKDSNRGQPRRRRYHKETLKSHVRDPRSRWNKAYLSEVLHQYEYTSPDGMIEVDENLLEMSVEDYAFFLEQEYVESADMGEEANQSEEYDESFDDDRAAYIITNPKLLALAALRSDEYIVDSGCIGGHILKSEDLVRNLAEPRYDSNITGFTGDGMKPSKVGVLLNTRQRVFVMPSSVVNLLSLQEIVQGGGSHDGDEYITRIYDRNKKLILVARNRGNGLMVVTREQLIKAFGSSKAYTTNVVDDSFYSTEEKARAREAFQLCQLVGHVGDASIIKMLNHGGYRHTYLTAADFRRARKLFGPCLACQEGKMTAGLDPLTPSPPPGSIGDKVHADLIELPFASVGNVKQLLISVDEKSGMKAMSKMEGKSSAHLRIGFNDLLTIYNSHQHRVQTVITDDEVVLRGAREFLSVRGVNMSHSPAGFHERMVERAIRHIKEVFRAILANLSYRLPSNLWSEAYAAAIRSINNAPNSKTGNRSAYEVFTKSKPFIPRYFFGQIGLFHHIHTQDGLRQTAEMGIFLNYGAHERYLRAYLPGRMRIVSMAKFVPVANQTPPVEWNFKARVKAVPTLEFSPTPIEDDVESPPVVNPLSTADPEPPTEAVPEIQQVLNPLPPEPVPPEPISQPVIPSPVRIQLRPSSILSSPTSVPITPTRTGTGSSNPTPNPPVIPIDRSIPPTTSTSPTDSPVNDPPLLPASSPPQSTSSPDRGIAPPALPLSPPLRQEGDILPRAEGGTTREGVTLRRSTRLASLPTRTWTREVAGPFVRNKKAHLADATVLFVANPFDVTGYKVSLKQALQDQARVPQILGAIKTEIDNMERPGVMSVIKFDDIPMKYRKDIIGVWLMYTQKFKSDGSFDKDKARIVTLSQHRDPTTIGETFAPTVNPLSLMTQIQEAATNSDIWMCSYDIRHAFLMTPIKPPNRYFIRVPPDVVKYWVSFYPERKAFIHADGHLYFELNVYLYGLQESPHYFNAMLDDDLKRMGFVPTTGDRCFYVKFTKDGWIKISTHVDDQFVTGYNRKLKLWFERELKKKYEFTIQDEAPGISHLGMMVKRTNQGITITQQGYTRNLLTKFRVSKSTKYPATPANDTLMREVDSPEISRNQYLSLVMSLLFLARFTRPDILFATTYLATKSAHPTEYHYQMCQYILNYLAGSPDTGIVYSKYALMKPTIYADSSHILHSDAKGHGGIVITLGSAPILVKSFKLRLVTRSSSESELVSLEEAVSYAMYLKTFLAELRLWKPTNPITVFQDNLSTIRIATAGPSFKRSRHLLVKEGYVRQYVESNDVILEYLRSTDMVADMMTKVLPRAQLNHQMKLLFIKPIKST